MPGKVKIKLPLKRKLIQLYAALLYNAHLKGYLEGNIYTGRGKFLCVPGLNCYSCPGAAASCPLGALQNALAAAGNRAPYYALGILLLFGLTLGRTICGWLCPVGLVQELLHKIPTPKVPKSRLTRALSSLKYLILAVSVIALPLLSAFGGAPLPAFCKYICPAGTLEGAVGLLAHPANADKFSMLGRIFTRKWAILTLLIAASVFVYRAFCRFVCPLGAIYGLFNRFAWAGIRIDDQKCIHCGRCVARCPMDVQRICDRECIGCGQCIAVCPKNAISLRVGRHICFGETDEANRSTGFRPIGAKAKRCAAAALALLLAAVVLIVNLPAPARGADPESAAPADSAAFGHEVGQTLSDFALTTIFGDTFALSACRGKTVVINLWATWCGPCVNELPFFEALCEAHPDDVAILAIHSDLVTEDVAAFLSKYDYTFPFAIDETGKTIAALGGSAMLPQTLVINGEGVVVYNQVGSVTAEKLEALVTQAEQSLYRIRNDHDR